MNQLQALGICLVGTGAIAARHAAALSSLPNCSLKWVIGREKSAAQKFAAEHQFTSSSVTIADALSDANIDVVLIASPNQLHAGQAMQALDAGKHVIVEIPLALSLGEATTMRERAKACERRVFVCHTLRASRGLREVQRRVQAQELHLAQISGCFRIPRRRNQNVRGRRNWVDNLLWHHGGHQIDATLWVMGFPPLASCAAVLGKLHPDFKMVMDVGLVLRATDGRIATHSLTYNADRPFWELRFVCDEEVLTLQDGGLFNERGERLTQGTSEDDLALQDSEILTALHNGNPSYFDLDAIYPTLEAIERAQEFADRNS